MNKLLFYLIAGFLFSFSTCNNLVAQKIYLVNKWDTIRPLVNPDKGWYHNMLDNGIGKYLIQDESDLTGFPGMDHLYLRLAWAFLEPEEGKFDWSNIADLTSVFPNPERGWHNRRDVDCRGSNDDRDFSDVRAAGHTLLHSYLRLDDYKNTDTIPQTYLDDLQEALDAIRVNGGVLGLHVAILQPVLLKIPIVRSRG